MTDLKCPRCGLSIRIRASYLMLRNCPRCLARAGLPTPMYVSPRADRTQALAASAQRAVATLTPARLGVLGGREEPLADEQISAPPR